jgi:hypothetical protein
MAKHKKNESFLNNPKDKISDAKPSAFKNNNGRKVDHDTLDSHSREDILDQRTNQSPRDSI